MSRSLKTRYMSLMARAVIVAALTLISIPGLALTSDDFTQAGAEADAKLFGVEAVRVGDRLEFRVTVDGEPKTLFITEISNVDLESLQRRLKDLVESKSSQLEQRFKIRIAKDGERTSYVGFLPTLFNYGPTPALVETRQPRLNELYILEQALLHSEPSQLLGLSEDSPGITMYFLKDMRIIGTAAQWGLDHRGQPAIFVEPYYVIASGQGLTDPALTRNVRELKEILIHEFAHNASHRMGWNMYSPEKWSMVQKLGCRFHWNPKTGEQQWLLESKEDTRFYYRRITALKRWVRCDKSGRPLKEDGSVTEYAREAYCVDTSSVSKLAVITPPTTYFYNPMEMFAEAMMMYRFGGPVRERLQATSPQLFSLMQEQDQEEIDRTFGKGKFTRSPDGTLVKAGTETPAEPLSSTR